MKDLLLEYEESIKFKKLGFNDACFAYFDESNDLEPYKKFTSQFEDMVNSNLPSINDSFLDGVSKPFECCTVPTYDQAIEFIFNNHYSYADFFVKFISNHLKDSKIKTGISSYFDAKKDFIKVFLENVNNGI